MKVELLAVPFDSGLRDARMGRGPARMLESGLADALEQGGAEVRVTVIDPRDPFPAEIRTAFALQRAVADSVGGALTRGALPIVLSGNCNTAVGTVAGMTRSSHSTPTVLWLDAHGDYNTPETTSGGFLDGMALAMLTGRCWREMTAQVRGFEPVPESAVFMVGTRDLDPAEGALLRASDIRLLGPASDPDALVDRIAAAGAADLYLHVDLDVLDTAEGRANGYAVGGGVTRTELLALVRALRERLNIRALGFSAYDPEHDPEGVIARIAIEVASVIARP